MPLAEPGSEVVAPRLCVVIPVLDEAATIVTCLERLSEWRQQGIEVIVVDGGSKDDTRALARPLADQVIDGPRGRARQMNRGAAAASAQALLFLHADTHLPPAAMPAILKALEKRHWGRFDVCIQGRSRWLYLIAASMNLRSRLTGIATGDQAMFMRRSAFDAVGGFPDQPLMEDIEVSKRLKRLSPPACLGVKVLTDGRRWEQGGVLTTILLMWRLRFRYWRGADPVRLAEEYRHVR